MNVRSLGQGLRCCHPKRLAARVPNDVNLHLNVPSTGSARAFARSSFLQSVCSCAALNSWTIQPSGSHYIVLSPPRAPLGVNLTSGGPRAATTASAQPEETAPRLAQSQHHCSALHAAAFTFIISRTSASRRLPYLATPPPKLRVRATLYTRHRHAYAPRLWAGPRSRPRSSSSRTLAPSRHSSMRCAT